MKGSWSGAARDRIWLIFIWNSTEIEKKLVWDSPGQNPIQISIENERKLVWGSAVLNLIDFYSNLNQNERTLVGDSPRQNLEACLAEPSKTNWKNTKKQSRVTKTFKNHKRTNNKKHFWEKGRAGGGQNPIQILIQNERQFVWSSPVQNLSDFYSNLISIKNKRKLAGGSSRHNLKAFLAEASKTIGKNKKNQRNQS